MKSTKSDSFTASHSFYMYFIHFCYLVVVASTFNSMLNRNCKSGHPCLVPDFRGQAFSFSPLSMMLAVAL